MPMIDNLGPGGTIAQKLGNYEERPQQLEMASAVEDALQDEHHLIVEANGECLSMLLDIFMNLIAKRPSDFQVDVSLQ